MSQADYYEYMKSLAHQVRSVYSLRTQDISLSTLRKIYKKEGIRIDYWKFPLRKVRGAYFPNDGEPCVLVDGRIKPKEPKIFILSHELKHHYLDSSSVANGGMACHEISWSSRSPLELSAQMFAAEFIYPEDEMKSLLDTMGIGQGNFEKEDLVHLMQACPALVSYSFLTRRLESFKIIERGAFKGIQFRKLEYSLIGKPFYLPT